MDSKFELRNEVFLAVGACYRIVIFVQHVVWNQLLAVYKTDITKLAEDFISTLPKQNMIFGIFIIRKCFITASAFEKTATNNVKIV